MTETEQKDVGQIIITSQRAVAAALEEAADILEMERPDMEGVGAMLRDRAGVYRAELSEPYGSSGQRDVRAEHTCASGALDLAADVLRMSDTITLAARDAAAQRLREMAQWHRDKRDS